MSALRCGCGGLVRPESLIHQCDECQRRRSGERLHGVRFTPESTSMEEVFKRAGERAVDRFGQVPTDIDVASFYRVSVGFTRADLPPELEQRPEPLRVPSDLTPTNVVSLADARAKRLAGAAKSYDTELSDLDIPVGAMVFGIENRAGDHRVGPYAPNLDGWALTPDQAEELASWLQRYAEQARNDAQES